MTAQSIFQAHTENLCRDPRAEKIGRAFAPYCFDGTEVHGVVDHELCGLEHGVTAINIKTAIEAKYRNTVPLDTIVEVFGKLFDKLFGERELT